MPVDYTICGLVAGTAEQLIKRKFISMETSCIAHGDGKCTIETLSTENFKKKLNAINNPEQKKVLKKILELEEKTDFEKEVKTLLENRDKKALMQENNYLKNRQII